MQFNNFWSLESQSDICMLFVQFGIAHVQKCPIRKIIIVHMNHKHAHLTSALHLVPADQQNFKTKLNFQKKKSKFSVVHSSFTYSICIYYTWSKMSTSFCVAIILLLCSFSVECTSKNEERPKKTCRSKRHIRRHTSARALCFFARLSGIGFCF